MKALKKFFIGGLMTCTLFSALGLTSCSGKYTTNEQEINERITSVLIDTEISDIAILSSENGECKVVCYERPELEHSVTITDGTLKIHQLDKRKWYQFIGLNFDNSKLTVYLPEGEYDMLKINGSTGDILVTDSFVFSSIDISNSTGDVKNYASASTRMKISTSTGDIDVKNTSAGSIELSASTGDIELDGIECAGDIFVDSTTGGKFLSDITCQNLSIKSSTGDMKLENILAKTKLSIVGSTGDVHFTDCDAGEIFVKVSTGDVKGTLLSEKIFIVDTSAGKTDVPKTTTGGVCEITTSTGNIKITINE